MVIIWGVSLKMVELILLYGGAKFESYKGKLNVVLGLNACRRASISLHHDFVMLNFHSFPPLGPIKF